MLYSPSSFSEFPARPHPSSPTLSRYTCACGWRAGTKRYQTIPAVRSSCIDGLDLVPPSLKDGNKTHKLWVYQFKCTNFRCISFICVNLMCINLLTYLKKESKAVPKKKLRGRGELIVWGDRSRDKFFAIYPFKVAMFFYCCQNTRITKRCLLMTKKRRGF